MHPSPKLTGRKLRRRFRHMRRTVDHQARAFSKQKSKKLISLEKKNISSKPWPYANALSNRNLVSVVVRSGNVLSAEKEIEKKHTSDTVDVSRSLPSAIETEMQQNPLFTKFDKEGKPEALDKVNSVNKPTRRESVSSLMNNQNQAKFSDKFMKTSATPVRIWCPSVSYRLVSTSSSNYSDVRNFSAKSSKALSPSLKSSSNLSEIAQVQSYPDSYLKKLFAGVPFESQFKKVNSPKACLWSSTETPIRTDIRMSSSKSSSGSNAKKITVVVSNPRKVDKFKAENFYYSDKPSCETIDPTRKLNNGTKGLHETSLVSGSDKQDLSSKDPQFQISSTVATSCTEQDALPNQIPLSSNSSDKHTQLLNVDLSYPIFVLAERGNGMNRFFILSAFKNVYTNNSSSQFFLKLLDSIQKEGPILLNITRDSFSIPMTNTSAPNKTLKVDHSSAANTSFTVLKENVNESFPQTTPLAKVVNLPKVSDSEHYTSSCARSPKKTFNFSHNTSNISDIVLQGSLLKLKVDPYETIKFWKFGSHCKCMQDIADEKLKTDSEFHGKKECLQPNEKISFSDIKRNSTLSVPNIVDKPSRMNKSTTRLCSPNQPKVVDTLINTSVTGFAGTPDKSSKVSSQSKGTDDLCKLNQVRTTDKPAGIDRIVAPNQYFKNISTSEFDDKNETNLVPESSVSKKSTVFIFLVNNTKQAAEATSTPIKVLDDVEKKCRKKLESLQEIRNLILNKTCEDDEPFEYLLEKNVSKSLKKLSKKIDSNQSRSSKDKEGYVSNEKTVNLTREFIEKTMNSLNIVTKLPFLMNNVLNNKNLKTEEQSAHLGQTNVILNEDRLGKFALKIFMDGQEVYNDLVASHPLSSIKVNRSTVAAGLKIYHSGKETSFAPQQIPGVKLKNTNRQNFIVSKNISLTTIRSRQKKRKNENIFKKVKNNILNLRKSNIGFVKGHKMKDVPNFLFDVSKNNNSSLSEERLPEAKLVESHMQRSLKSYHDFDEIAGSIIHFSDQFETQTPVTKVIEVEANDSETNSMNKSSNFGYGENSSGLLSKQKSNAVSPSFQDLVTLPLILHSNTSERSTFSRIAVMNALSPSLNSSVFFEQNFSVHDFDLHTTSSSETSKKGASINLFKERNGKNLFFLSNFEFESTSFRPYLRALNHANIKFYCKHHPKIIKNESMLFRNIPNESKRQNKNKYGEASSENLDPKKFRSNDLLEYIISTSENFSDHFFNEPIKKGNPSVNYSIELQLPSSQQVYEALKFKEQSPTSVLGCLNFLGNGNSSSAHSEHPVQGDSSPIDSFLPCAMIVFNPQNYVPSRSTKPAPVTPTSSKTSIINPDFNILSPSSKPGVAKSERSTETVSSIENSAKDIQNLCDSTEHFRNSHTCANSFNLTNPDANIFSHPKNAMSNRPDPSNQGTHISVFNFYRNLKLTTNSENISDNGVSNSNISERTAVLNSSESYNFTNIALNNALFDGPGRNPLKNRQVLIHLSFVSPDFNAFCLSKTLNDEFLSSTESLVLKPVQNASVSRSFLNKVNVKNVSNPMSISENALNTSVVIKNLSSSVDDPNQNLNLSSSLKSRALENLKITVANSMNVINSSTFSGTSNRSTLNVSLESLSPGNSCINRNRSIFSSSRANLAEPETLSIQQSTVVSSIDAVFHLVLKFGDSSHTSVTSATENISKNTFAPRMDSPPRCRKKYVMMTENAFSGIFTNNSTTFDLSHSRNKTAFSQSGICKFPTVNFAVKPTNNFTKGKHSKNSLATSNFYPSCNESAHEGLATSASFFDWFVDFNSNFNGAPNLSTVLPQYITIPKIPVFFSKINSSSTYPSVLNFSVIRIPVPPKILNGTASNISAIKSFNMLVCTENMTLQDFKNFSSVRLGNSSDISAMASLGLKMFCCSDADFSKISLKPSQNNLLMNRSLWINLKNKNVIASQEKFVFVPSEIASYPLKLLSAASNFTNVKLNRKKEPSKLKVNVRNKIQFLTPVILLNRSSSLELNSWNTTCATSKQRIVEERIIPNVISNNDNLDPSYITPVPSNVELTDKSVPFNNSYQVFQESYDSSTQTSENVTLELPGNGTKSNKPIVKQQQIYKPSYCFIKLINFHDTNGNEFLFMKNGKKSNLLLNDFLKQKNESTPSESLQLFILTKSYLDANPDTHIKNFIDFLFNSIEQSTTKNVSSSCFLILNEVTTETNPVPTDAPLLSAILKDKEVSNVFTNEISKYTANQENWFKPVCLDGGQEENTTDEVNFSLMNLNGSKLYVKAADVSLRNIQVNVSHAKDFTSGTNRSFNQVMEHHFTLQDLTTVSNISAKSANAVHSDIDCVNTSTEKSASVNYTIKMNNLENVVSGNSSSTPSEFKKARVSSKSSNENSKESSFSLTAIEQNILEDSTAELKTARKTQHEDSPHAFTVFYKPLNIPDSNSTHDLAAQLSSFANFSTNSLSGHSIKNMIAGKNNSKFLGSSIAKQNYSRISISKPSSNEHNPNQNHVNSFNEKKSNYSDQNLSLKKSTEFTKDSLQTSHSKMKHNISSALKSCIHYVGNKFPCASTENPQAHLSSCEPHLKINVEGLNVESFSEPSNVEYVTQNQFSNISMIMSGRPSIGSSSVNRHLSSETPASVQHNVLRNSNRFMRKEFSGNASVSSDFLSLSSTDTHQSYFTLASYIPNTIHSSMVYAADETASVVNKQFFLVTHNYSMFAKPSSTSVSQRLVSTTTQLDLPFNLQGTLPVSQSQYLDVKRTSPSYQNISGDDSEQEFLALNSLYSHGVMNNSMNKNRALIPNFMESSGISGHQQKLLISNRSLFFQSSQAGSDQNSHSNLIRVNTSFSRQPVIQLASVTEPRIGISFSPCKKCLDCSCPNFPSSKESSFLISTTERTASNSLNASPLIQQFKSSLYPRVTPNSVLFNSFNSQIFNLSSPREKFMSFRKKIFHAPLNNSICYSQIMKHGNIAEPDILISQLKKDKTSIYTVGKKNCLSEIITPSTCAPFFNISNNKKSLKEVNISPMQTDIQPGATCFCSPVMDSADNDQLLREVRPVFGSELSQGNHSFIFSKPSLKHRPVFIVGNPSSKKVYLYSPADSAVSHRHLANDPMRVEGIRFLNPDAPMTEVTPIGDLSTKESISANSDLNVESKQLEGEVTDCNHLSMNNVALTVFDMQQKNTSFQDTVFRSTNSSPHNYQASDGQPMFAIQINSPPMNVTDIDGMSQTDNVSSPSHLKIPANWSVKNTANSICSLIPTATLLGHANNSVTAFGQKYIPFRPVNNSYRSFVTHANDYFSPQNSKNHSPQDETLAVNDGVLLSDLPSIDDVIDSAKNSFFSNFSTIPQNTVTAEIGSTALNSFIKSSNNTEILHDLYASRKGGLATDNPSVERSIGMEHQIVRSPILLSSPSTSFLSKKFSRICVSKLPNGNKPERVNYGRSLAHNRLDLQTISLPSLILNPVLGMTNYNLSSVKDPSAVNNIQFPVRSREKSNKLMNSYLNLHSLKPSKLLEKNYYVSRNPIYSSTMMWDIGVESPSKNGASSMRKFSSSKEKCNVSNLNTDAVYNFLNAQYINGTLHISSLSNIRGASNGSESLIASGKLKYNQNNCRVHGNSQNLPGRPVLTDTHNYGANTMLTFVNDRSSPSRVSFEKNTVHPSEMDFRSEDEEKFHFSPTTPLHFLQSDSGSRFTATGDKKTTLQSDILFYPTKSVQMHNAPSSFRKPASVTVTKFSSHTSVNTQLDKDISGQNIEESPKVKNQCKYMTIDELTGVPQNKIIGNNFTFFNPVYLQVNANVDWSDRNFFGKVPNKPVVVKVLIQNITETTKNERSKNRSKLTPHRGLKSSHRRINFRVQSNLFLSDHSKKKSKFHSKPNSLSRKVSEINRQADSSQEIASVLSGLSHVTPLLPDNSPQIPEIKIQLAEKLQTTVTAKKSMVTEKMSTLDKMATARLIKIMFNSKPSRTNQNKYRKTQVASHAKKQPPKLHQQIYDRAATPKSNGVSDSEPFDRQFLRKLKNYEYEDNIVSPHYHSDYDLRSKLMEDYTVRAGSNSSSVQNEVSTLLSLENVWIEGDLSSNKPDNQDLMNDKFSLPQPALFSNVSETCPNCSSNYQSNLLSIKKELDHFSDLLMSILSNCQTNSESNNSEDLKWKQLSQKRILSKRQFTTPSTRIYGELTAPVSNSEFKYFNPLPPPPFNFFQLFQNNESYTSNNHAVIPLNTDNVHYLSSATNQMNRGNEIVLQNFISKNAQPISRTTINGSLFGGNILTQNKRFNVASQFKNYPTPTESSSSRFFLQNSSSVTTMKKSNDPEVLSEVAGNQCFDSCGHNRVGLSQEQNLDWFVPSDQNLKRNKNLIFKWVQKLLENSTEPAKHLEFTAKDCKTMYHSNCACDMSKVLSDYDQIICDKRSSEDFKLPKILDYQCTNYLPLPMGYKISSDAKPRILTSKKKQMVSDDKNGPKEIDAEGLNYLLHAGVISVGSPLLHYAFAGSKITVPCFDSSKVSLPIGAIDGTQYKWQKGGKIITDGRMKESPEGVLIIENVALNDVGHFLCTVSFISPDTSSHEQRTFNHSVIVVTVPKIAIQALIHYKANAECKPEILEMFDLYLPQLIQESICDFGEENNDICLIDVYNPLCFKNNTDSTIVSLNVQMDVKGIDYLIIGGYANKTVCSPVCHQKLYLKTSLILKESLHEALLTTVFGRTSFTGADFVPMPTSLDLKMTIGCDAGFYQVENFCVPCPPHSFSNEGSTQCTKCPSGSYQPQLGSRACLPCPSPLTPGCNIIHNIFDHYKRQDQKKPADNDISHVESHSSDSGLKNIFAKFLLVVLLALSMYCVFKLISTWLAHGKWKHPAKKAPPGKRDRKDGKKSKLKRSSRRKKKSEEIELLEMKPLSFRDSDDSTEFAETVFGPSVTEVTRTAGYFPSGEELFGEKRGDVKEKKSKTMKELEKSSKDMQRRPQAQKGKQPKANVEYAELQDLRSLRKENLDQRNTPYTFEHLQKVEKSMQTPVKKKIKPVLPKPDFT